MDTESPTTEDESLRARAVETAETAFDPEAFGGAHIVSAAIRAESGTTYVGTSLPASIGRASMCAEPVALGSLKAAGEDGFDACVAVRHPLPDEDDRSMEVVPPCGPCRELLADYAPDARVQVPVDGEVRVVRAMDLLPTRNW